MDKIKLSKQDLLNYYNENKYKVTEAYINEMLKPYYEKAEENGVKIIHNGVFFEGDIDVVITDEHKYKAYIFDLLDRNFPSVFWNPLYIELYDKHIKASDGILLIEDYHAVHKDFPLFPEEAITNFEEKVQKIVSSEQYMFKSSVSHTIKMCVDRMKEPNKQALVLVSMYGEWEEPEERMVLR